MYPATYILDLREFSPERFDAAMKRACADKDAFRRDYRRTMTEIPNLHSLLQLFQTHFPENREACMFLWLRIWDAIKEDEAIRTDATMALLRRTADIHHSGIRFAPAEESKPDRYFFEILYELVQRG